MVYSTMIIICKLSSSHLDKCIVNLGLFSTTNISPGGNRGRARARTGEQLPPPLAPPMGVLRIGWKDADCKIVLVAYSV